MSHQVITRMAYNAKTKQIETWQHSNNVWPTTDHFYALDVKTDEQMFEFITLIASGSWQVRKWRKSVQYPFLKNIRNWSGPHTSTSLKAGPGRNIVLFAENMKGLPKASAMRS